MRRILLIILVIAFVIWLIKPEILLQLANQAGGLLKEKAQRQSQSVVTSAVRSVNQYVQEKSQAVLGEQIGLDLQIKPETKVVEDVPKKQLENIILVDYLTAKNLNLELSANKIYYLDLRNIPKEYCLYVNQDSYFVANDEYLSLSFPANGTYDLAFDKCDKKLQKFGQIIVE